MKMDRADALAGCDNRRMKLHLFAAAAVAVMLPMAASAQSDRIPIRMAPAPNQTAHGEMTIQMDVDVTIDGAAGAPLPGPMKMQMTSTMSQSFVVGPRDDTGGVTAHVTFDDVAASVTMNGQKLPVPTGAASVRGHDVTVTFDSTGTITDVSAQGVAVPEIVKRTMVTMLENLPVGTIAVGETVSLPLAFNLPLPGLGGTGLNATGSTTMTLAALGVQDGERIAHYTSHSDGHITFDGPSPLGSAPATVDLKITGSGSIDKDVDRGLTVAAEDHVTLEGDFHIAGPGGSPILIHMAGPVTMKQQLRPQE